MERSVYDLTLDMQQNHAFREITVKKGDTHRRLRFRLLSGGSTYPVSNDCYGVFTAQKPDGTVLYNRCSREGDRFIYDLTPQTSAVPGVLSCELRLYGPEDALLTTAAFALCVEDTVYTEGEEAITSTGEATALIQLITQAREGICEMEKVLQNEVNHAVIDDAKVGKDAWSSKKITDKLCPAFAESGAAVQCQPVEGYPLEVISTINPKKSGDAWGTIKLYHSGKNLCNYRPSYQVPSNSVVVEQLENGVIVQGSAGSTPGADYSSCGWFYPIGATDRGDNLLYLQAGQRICISADYTILEEPYGTHNGAVNITLRDPSEKIESVARRVYIAPEAGKKYKISTCADIKTTGYYCFFISLNSCKVKIENIQVEIGATATEYEPYNGQVLTADFANYPVPFGSYNWTTGVLTDEADNLYQHDPETNTFKMIDEESTAVVRGIHAYPGVNTLASDCGDTEVSGKADPTAIIEKLTNAIIALGGNV